MGYAGRFDTLPALTLPDFESIHGGPSIDILAYTIYMHTKSTGSIYIYILPPYIYIYMESV